MVSEMGSEMGSLSDVEQGCGHKQLLKTHMKHQSGLTYRQNETDKIEGVWQSVS